MTNETVWIVRAGEQGKDADFALRKKCAVINFSNWLFDFSGHSLAALRDRFKAEGTDNSPQQITRYAREAHDFASVIQPGDIVIVPRKPEENLVAIGIARHYEYVADDPNLSTRHRRHLRWLCKTLLRDIFRGNAVLEEIARRLPERSGTVFKIDRKDAVKKIDALLENNGDCK